jgi:predicted RNA-binding Zn-ribbon protein involved in translation (DUF1610 family)
MPHLPEDGKVRLPCPNCGHETTKTIEWVKGHTHFVCETCGATVSLDSEQLQQVIEIAEQAVQGRGF